MRKKAQIKKDLAGLLRNIEFFPINIGLKPDIIQVGQDESGTVHPTSFLLYKGYQKHQQVLFFLESLSYQATFLCFVNK
jgi:hypothetical protein